MMLYKDQLVLTGSIDDVGTPVRENSGESYRMGLEIETSIKFSDKFLLNANSTFSDNKNRSYITSLNGELVNLGKTNISFSPEIVSSLNLEYSPKENIRFSLLNKYVDDQFMSNTDSAVSKLKSYSILDFNFNYEIKSSKLFSNVSLTAMVNNIMGKKYVSNGYYYTYDDNWSDPNNISTIEGVGYYPQATTNFLLGIKLGL